MILPTTLFIVLAHFISLFSTVNGAAIIHQRSQSSAIATAASESLAAVLAPTTEPKSLLGRNYIRHSVAADSSDDTDKDIFAKHLSLPPPNADSVPRTGRAERFRAAQRRKFSLLRAPVEVILGGSRTFRLPSNDMLLW